MKKIFFGVYNPSIILTYIGIFCSITGVSIALCSPEYINISYFLFIMAAICDMFDGRIARKCKRTELEKEFGIQLDSLADVISFGVCPAILVFITVGNNYSILPILCFYMFAGVMRLGWFNITTESNPGMFQGMPIPFSAMIFPVCFVIGQIFPKINNPLFYTASLLTGILFISNFHLKKPGMKVYIIFLFMALIMGVVLFTI